MSKPRAYACFTDDGNVRLWSTNHAEIEGWAKTVGRTVTPLYDHPAPPSPAGSSDDWRDDPSSDERWNAGVDFAMEQLCAALGVEPGAVAWDAATETVEGDIQAVQWNIIRTAWGEDFDPAEAKRLRALVEGAIGEIATERRRQIEKEGWSLEHDDSHISAEMAMAAAVYALTSFLDTEHSRNMAFTRYWPWDRKWFKPEGGRRDLIRAGALIIAEIERLDRASLPPQERGDASR